MLGSSDFEPKSLSYKEISSPSWGNAREMLGKYCSYLTSFTNTKSKLPCQYKILCPHSASWLLSIPVGKASTQTHSNLCPSLVGEGICIEMILVKDA
jgi:hypothetical protein